MVLSLTQVKANNNAFQFQKKRTQLKRNSQQKGVQKNISQKLARKNVLDKKSTKTITKNHPSHSLLEPNGFSNYKYQSFKRKCLQERFTQGVGKSNQMSTLFRFWSHSLREHFAQQMYEDFKRFAVEDAAAGSSYGIQCLFRFYSYGLEKSFRPEVFADFQKLVLDDYHSGHLYGLEKLWAFLHYNKSTEPIVLLPELDHLLSTRFTSLAAFRLAEQTKNC